MNGELIGEMVEYVYEDGEKKIRLKKQYQESADFREGFNEGFVGGMEYAIGAFVEAESNVETESNDDIAEGIIKAFGIEEEKT